MGTGKPKYLRKSKRKATRKSTADSISAKYKSKFLGLGRVRTKPVSFTPCQNNNVYNKPWPPYAVVVTTVKIDFALSNGQPTNGLVETLGDQGAKWYLCNQLGKTITDGKAPFKQGYFYSFSGAHTVDSIFVDTNGHVHVIEAKGTQKGAAAHLITRQNGKKQGTPAYLAEVAGEMANSGDPLKAAAAAYILNTPANKLHYTGVQTTYSADASGVKAQKPKKIF